MEESIRENDFVLVICTPRYQGRSNERLSGVGYEGDIMTAEVQTRQNHRKFVPVLRQGKWTEAAPGWLLGKLYADLSGNPYSEFAFQQLVQNLFNVAEDAPPVGSDPGLLFTPKRVLRLMDEITSLEPAIRGAAAKQLALFGEDAACAVPMLCTLLGDDVESVSREAREALFQIGLSSSLVPALNTALSNVKAHTRANAARLLRGLGMAAEPAIPALVNLLADKASAWDPGHYPGSVGWIARCTLHDLGPCVIPHLAAAVDDAHPARREALDRLICHVKYTKLESSTRVEVIAPAISRALSSSDHEHQMWSAECLAHDLELATLLMPVIREVRSSPSSSLALKVLCLTCILRATPDDAQAFQDWHLIVVEELRMPSLHLSLKCGRRSDLIPLSIDKVGMVTEEIRTLLEKIDLSPLNWAETESECAYEYRVDELLKKFPRENEVGHRV